MKSSSLFSVVLLVALGPTILSTVACSSENSPDGSGGAAGRTQAGSSTGGTSPAGSPGFAGTTSSRGGSSDGAIGGATAGGSAGSAGSVTGGVGAAGAGGTGGSAGAASSDAASGGLASGGAAGGGAGVASGGAAGSAGKGGAGGRGGSGGAAGAAFGGMAGVSGAAGSGGAGGMPAYNPCPTNGDPCRVMPLGDSITDGVGSSHAAGYRLELFRRSLTNNKKLTFVGSHASGPDKVDGVTFPRQQEGHSGWTIDDGGGRQGLYPQIQGWLTATPPHIVTLMIGTNDVDLQLDVANAPQRFGRLLDRIITYAPDALVVVAQIVPTTDDNENQRVRAYNSGISALVQARADAGKHVALVDMYGAFVNKNANYKTEYMADKLHPKDAGYRVMADTWYDAIGSLLK